MGNLLDYLDWRGDLELNTVPFGEVDGLILSCLSYARLEDIVPGIGEGSITIHEAAKEFFRVHPQEELKKDQSFTNFSPRILEKCAMSRRFGNATVSHFVNEVDPSKDLQFSAMQIVTDDGIPFVSFRGTDDTLTGWKEDFNISYQLVPADRRAASYLEMVQKDDKRPLRIGGHSKGAHLAVYAASTASPSIKDRIIAIYEEDGPGFNEEMIRDSRMEKLAPLIHRVTPTTSIIGTLLLHYREPVIVKSSETGVNEHSPVSWQVMGDHFLLSPTYSRAGELFDETFNTWIAGEDMEHRKGFIDDLFSCLEASGATTVSELRRHTPKQTKAIWDRLRQINPESRVTLEKLITIFIGELFDAKGTIKKLVNTSLPWWQRISSEE